MAAAYRLLTLAPPPSPADQFQGGTSGGGVTGGCCQAWDSFASHLTLIPRVMTFMTGHTNEIPRGVADSPGLSDPQTVAHLRFVNVCAEGEDPLQFHCSPYRKRWRRLGHYAGQMGQRSL
ncbi:hypothetical protein NDU88_000994 [Pleurodeles waltl]|uniref:Uncharacterized protein n=1 Tax=Pleurodeles waltl TaxID=8319 RepID=A0AAV7Q2D7_PLEWA|nr:hypothetical protein NDU88_000994 [Pleurodeles waltl]